ncbi:MAG: DUF1566 domain-containing protein [Subdoligranulum sp.]|nr:DUF1566 domain-containing protein [Subdoligranulum sp.]
MKKYTVYLLMAAAIFFAAACSAPSDGSVSEDLPDMIRESAEVSESNSASKSKDTMQTAQFEPGDVILADGTVVKVAELEMIDSVDIPVAVIAGFCTDGSAFGLGVHQSDTPLAWAPESSPGYAMRFADTICTQNSAFDFSGDLDGGDNWTAMCAADEAGTAQAPDNYPAFDFVNTYAKTYGLPDACEDGWYLPDIAELCEIYQNRDAVNKSLKYLHSLDDQAAMDGLGTNWYWSSSQAGTVDDYAWFVHYLNGYAGECPKSFTNVHVIAIRKF